MMRSSSRAAVPHRPPASRPSGTRSASSAAVSTSRSSPSAEPASPASARAAPRAAAQGRPVDAAARCARSPGRAPARLGGRRARHVVDEVTRDPEHRGRPARHEALEASGHPPARGGPPTGRLCSVTTNGVGSPVSASAASAPARRPCACDDVRRRPSDAGSDDRRLLRSSPVGDVEYPRPETRVPRPDHLAGGQRITPCSERRAQRPARDVPPGPAGRRAATCTIRREPIDRPQPSEPDARQIAR